MSWRRRLRALWPFGRPDGMGAANAAVEAACRSHERAVEDHRQASVMRAEADAWAQQVRDHNVANNFDTWLREIIRGNMR